MNMRFNCRLHSIYERATEKHEVRILEESVSTTQVEDAALPACYETSHLPVTLSRDKHPKHLRCDFRYD